MDPTQRLTRERDEDEQGEQDVMPEAQAVDEDDDDDHNPRTLAHLLGVVRTRRGIAPEIFTFGVASGRLVVSVSDLLTPPNVALEIANAVGLLFHTADHFFYFRGIYPEFARIAIYQEAAPGDVRGQEAEDALIVDHYEWVYGGPRWAIATSVLTRFLTFVPDIVTLYLTGFLIYEVLL